MKEEERIIPKKNYIIIVMIFVITLIIVFVLRNRYIMYQDYQLTIPVISGTLNEIKDKEVYTYLDEIDDVMMYIGTAGDNNCRKLEKDLKKFVVDNDLKSKIIYLNITNVKNLNEFYDNFNENFVIDNRYIDSFPAFIIFKDGKVLDYVSKINNKYLTIGNIEQLLAEYEVIR